MEDTNLNFLKVVEHKTVRQFIKFALVGAINTAIDWGIFYGIILVFSFGDNQALSQLAKAISFLVAATSSFFMNRSWTFHSKSKKIGHEAAKFYAVSLVGLIINEAFFYLATGVLSWRRIFGLILATASATLWNFFANKKWTFKGL